MVGQVVDGEAALFIEEGCFNIGLGVEEVQDGQGEESEEEPCEKQTFGDFGLR